jgi:hypothetical protein
MKELQRVIEQSIKDMEVLMVNNPNGWIVETENHVCVGSEYGLNNTTFNVKSPCTNTKAIIYESIEDAEKYGFEYYLVDGGKRQIFMKAIRAVDFFQKEINNAKKLLVFINKI